ncbi:P27 family phage terminase small subunit [Clostridioides difficile]|uniref:P27 family phage terminase small subunit n=1 Tax=Clostridioides difficile TaxID=1496 RepID=UPI0025AA80AA|nr:P27 family phage terminase small subunit [Clostridioides difficile]
MQPKLWLRVQKKHKNEVVKMDDNEELEIRRDVQNDYVLGMTYKEMSAKYNIPENTLKSWRKRGGWTRNCTPKKGCVKNGLQESGNNLKNSIRKDLLRQIKENNMTEEYFKDLVEDYLKMWDIKNELIEDVKTRGVQVKYKNGQNQWGYKKNDSVSELIKYNAQMLSLLDKLGIKATPKVLGDDDIEL